MKLVFFLTFGNNGINRTVGITSTVCILVYISPSNEAALTDALIRKLQVTIKIIKMLT